MTDTRGPTDDTPSTTPTPSAEGGPRLIPPEPREAGEREDAPPDVVPETIMPAEQLGFQMRFEAGQALLALENRPADDGITIRRALFEVPDVDFPLDVSGGALRFQSKRLNLRAVELAVAFEALFLPEILKAAGLTLLRERARAGGLEIVVSIDGTGGPVPVRARCIFAPVGDGGVALVLHEIIGFGPLPRRRLHIASALLDALQFPGGREARAMVRRAEPFRAVFGRLLPRYGWKVPSLGDVRVHEASLAKGEVVLRAWSGRAPDGWKPAREQKRGPLAEAVNLAVLADGLADAVDDVARIKLIDRLMDEGALSASAIPFAAEILRSDSRRRHDGDDLVNRAIADDDEHLGLLAAHADVNELEPLERAKRLMALSEAADNSDEPWVAGRAALEAARLADDAGDVDAAIENANAAVEADPSVAEAGILSARLLAKAGQDERALAVGRAALERAGSGSLIEPAADLDAADAFAVELSFIARRVEGIDAARSLLRRALRQQERADALIPLVELEIEAGALERAAEGLTRLLSVVDDTPSKRKHVELLAARLAEKRGDLEAARAHLLAARDLDPRDAKVALHLARLAEGSGDLDRALTALNPVLDDAGDGDLDAQERRAVDDARLMAARLVVVRARGGAEALPGARGNAERARNLVAMLSPKAQATPVARRLDAEAQALLGAPWHLARLMVDDAGASRPSNVNDDDKNNEGTEGNQSTAPATLVLAARHFMDGVDGADRPDNADNADNADGADVPATLVDEAAKALAQSMVFTVLGGAGTAGTVGVDDVVMAHAGRRDFMAAFAAALDASDANDGRLQEARRHLGARLAEAHAAPALVLLQGLDDVQSRLLRARCAADIDDVDVEIAEVRGLLPLVADGDRAPHWVRLAGLLGRTPDAPADAADAWKEAAGLLDGLDGHEGGDDAPRVDVRAWALAAVAAGDPQRIAVVAAREDCDLSAIPSDALRPAINVVDDDVVRRRLLAALASRNDDVGDVERWLDAARQLPPRESALAFVEAARINARADWLFEGIDRLTAPASVDGNDDDDDDDDDNEREAGAADAPAGLDAIMSVLEGSSETEHRLAADGTVLDHAFALALRVDDASRIEDVAGRILARGDLDANERDGIRRRQCAAHAAHVDVAERAALHRAALLAWLDEHPAHLEPLHALIPALCSDIDDGAAALSLAVERLDAARASQSASSHGSSANNDDVVRDLVQQVADTARELGVPAERRARELLLGFDLDSAIRERVQRRLVDLNIRDGRVDSAVDLLHTLVGQASDADAQDSVLAALWLRIADLEEEERKDRRAAADALTQMVHFAADDAHNSQRLQGLLLELGDDDGLANECLRRAGTLGPSAERVDLLLRAASIARRFDRLDDARRIGLRAIRGGAFQQGTLDAVLDLARHQGSRRLAIRARLAAAHALRTDNPADAARHAAEAGGLLAGVLRRTALAVVAYDFSRAALVAAGDDDSAPIRMLVELHRALGNGAETVAHLDTLIARSEGKEQARLYEARADARATLQSDVDGAIADRRTALALDPAFAAAARALGRQLIAAGDLRGAIAVERTHIDASLFGETRGWAYARLSASAEEGIGDPTLTADLCEIALGEREDVDVRRRLVEARAALGDGTGLIAALRGLLEQASTPAERVKVALRLAGALVADAPVGTNADDTADATDTAPPVDRAERAAEARQILRSTLVADDVQARLPVDSDDAFAAEVGYDAAIVLLCRLDAEHGALALAGRNLVESLGAFARGPAFADRVSLLEQAAVWLDDAEPSADHRDGTDGTAGTDDETARAALETFNIAATEGQLTDDGEVRRARLAEELGAHADAVTALNSLISRNVEVAANARRLAVAAERADDLPQALQSWRLCLADDDTDVDAWLAAERLAATLEDAEALREARDALVALAVGSLDEQASRAEAAAHDAHHRQGDRLAAVTALDGARQLKSTQDRRALLLQWALPLLDAAGDDALAAALDPAARQTVAAIALATLDEADQHGDPFSARERRQRAALRLEALDASDQGAGVSGAELAEEALALQDILKALDAGLDVDDARPLVEQLVARAPTVVADALLRSGIGPQRGLLRTALRPLIEDATLPDDDTAATDATQEGASIAPSLDRERVLALAGALVSDLGLAHLAARYEVADGAPDAGADRLLQLARQREAQQQLEHFDDAAIEEIRRLIDVAAEILIPAGAQYLTPRLDDLRPALRRQSALRDGVLTAFRDAEAWREAAVVLEDAVVATDDSSERRTLRLQLVAILREGVETADAERQAIIHLEQLVAEDSGDREAWGELFESLEHLQDTEGLQRALGERAVLASGLEGRQLVRRRVELLLALGRPQEGLGALAQVRPAGDDDAELRALQLALHVAIDGEGPPQSVASFHATELGATKGAAAVENADALLNLPASVVADVAPAGRVDALVSLARATGNAIGGSEAVAQRVLETTWSGLDGETTAVDAQSRRREAIALLGALDGAEREQCLRALLAAAVAHGDAFALALTDDLFAVDTLVAAHPEALLASGAMTGFLRRWRLAGVQATDVDVERLHRLQAGNAEHRARFRRAARLGNHEALTAAAAILGVDDGVLPMGLAAQATADIATRAAEQVADVSPILATLALVRHGDPRALAAFAALADVAAAGTQADAARRIAHLPLPPLNRGDASLVHVQARLAACPHLDEHASVALLNTLSVAIHDAILDDTIGDDESARLQAVEAEVLDALFARTDPGATQLLWRADAAHAAGHDDAAHWAGRAADRIAAELSDTIVIDGAPTREDGLRLRRRAIEHWLRVSDNERLGPQLLALANAAPTGADGDAIREEALGTAEATRLTDVVDAILVAAEAQLQSVGEREEAVVRRARLRLEHRDAQGALAALQQAIRTINDVDAAERLRQEAYDVAAGAGLVQAMLDVVGDALAQAGLLAVLGRRTEARDAAVALADQTDDAPQAIAAAWLLADLARESDDVAAEEAALTRLAEAGAADEAVLLRLVDAARRRGDIDDACRRATDLVGRGLTPARMELLNACAEAPVDVSLREAAVDVLLASAADEGLARDLREAALQRAADLGQRLDDPRRRLLARRALATLKDDDRTWVDTIRVDLRDGDVDELPELLRPHLGRPGVMGGLVEVIAVDEELCARLAEALLALNRAGAHEAVLTLFASLQAAMPDGLPWRLVEAHAAALEVAGESRAAADLLTACVAHTAAAPVRRFLIRASELYVEVEAPGAAARALLTLPEDAVDDAVAVHAKAVITAAARDGVMSDGAQLAAHIGRITGDDSFVTLALGLADAAGGDTALRIAAWRLQARDVRALPLLAHHSLEGSEAQGFFGAWHSLRSGVRAFVDHAPADFSRINSLHHQQDIGPDGVTLPDTALSRARVGKTETRQAAWRAVAEAQEKVDELGAARLLQRAGVPMSEAPLHVRLAVDSTLGDDTARAAAIASGLESVAPERRADVCSMFDGLTKRGSTTASQRLAVDVAAHRERTGLAPLADRLDVGESVDVAAMVRSLGRHPSPQTRALAGAILQAVGLPALAAQVHPALVANNVVLDTERLAVLREASVGVRALSPTDTLDDEDGFGPTPDAVLEGDDALERLGQLRLAQLAGPRVEIEERIAALAERLGRNDLLAESLHRLARLHSDPADQSAALLRHADVVGSAPGDDIASARAGLRSARAAFALAPNSHTAAVVARFAEASGDANAAVDALDAFIQTSSGSERLAAVVRRARVLTTRMLRPEQAIEGLDAALADTPSSLLLLEKASIYEQFLGQPRDAGLAILATLSEEATGEPPPPPAIRQQRRRDSARLLRQSGSTDDVGLAVSVLCDAFEDGEVAALDDAENLAREHGTKEALASVLDLRLRETEDIGARRELVLERARLLMELDETMGAIALLETQAVADPIDLGARLALAEWYLGDRRVLDAALAYESAARIPGLPPAGFGPPAKEAASLLAALGDLERAGPLADLAVDAGVFDLEVLSVAEAWHRGHERFSTVDELLGKELEHINDPRREAHLWMERAQVRRDRLGDETGAKKALHKVLELVPDHPRALQMMREDAERQDAWGALRMALFRAVESVDDSHRQVGWLQEMAALDQERLGDAKAAQATIDRALELEPENTDSLVLKARLMVAEGRLDGLSAVMDRIEKQGVGELPGQLHLVRGDALLVAGERDEAQTAFRLATEDPDTSAKAWDRLIDMADGTTTALPLLEDARQATLDTARRLKLWRKELRLQLKLSDADGATFAAESVLTLDAGDTEALDLVKDAYRRRRKQRDLLPYLVEHARAVDEDTHPAERADRLAAVGVFALDELGQEGSARTFFEEALGLAPDQQEALVRLADIAWASHDDDRALALLDRITPEKWVTLDADDGSLRTVADLYFRRARCAYALGNADVRERLRQVLRAEAKHAAALDMLARVATEQGDDDAAEHALEALSQAISPGDDPVRLAAVYVDLAQLRLRKGKPGDAETAAERAFELDATNLAVLQTVAEAREGAKRPGEAAEAWRRLATVRVGDERVFALNRRALALEAAERTKDAIDAWIDLHNETGEPAHKARATSLAETSGMPELVARAGGAPREVEIDAPDLTRTQSMAVAPGASGGALMIQMRANLDEGDAARALELAQGAQATGPLDADCTRLAVDAAEAVGRHDLAVDFAEARLKQATELAEIGSLSLKAGRLARDRLHDDDRAAGLLYQAHQANADDVDVRFELTELYARIPRLSSHAVTGILQLLRRTPADARVFALAGTLSEAQGQPERAFAMRAIEQVLRGTGIPAELLSFKGNDERPAASVLPLDRESIATRMAPTGWGGPLQQLITLLGVHLEVALGGTPSPPDAKPLVQASPRSAALLERVDRLLPGRPVQTVIADVDRLMVTSGGIPQVVIPRDLLANEAALLAAIARGVGIVRLGALVTEVVPQGHESDFVDLLKAGLLGEGPKDARTEILTARLREDERLSAIALMQQVVAAPIDIPGLFQLLTRAVDRFVLVATGSAMASLQTGALPTLLREPPQRAMVLLQGSLRALELCAFAARDNAWLIRRQHLLRGP